MKKLLLFSVLLCGCADTNKDKAAPRMERVEIINHGMSIYRDNKTGKEFLIIQGCSAVELGDSK